jgi:uncharacterized membrane protein YcaP (DUF421 family)
MGKRQVGELEISELVITFMISELATMPIQNPSIPLSYVVIPIVVLVVGEIVSSFLVTKSKLAKKIILGNPSYIIKRGKLNQRELSRLRMGISELLYELRLKDIDNISNVDYAILEENGKLSVFEKGKSKLSHALIIDGEIVKSNLELISKDEAWVLNYLKRHNLNLKDIFLLSGNEDLSINIIMKEK